MDGAAGADHDVGVGLGGPDDRTLFSAGVLGAEDEGLVEMVGAGGELNVDGAGGGFPGEFGLHGAAGTLEAALELLVGLTGMTKGWAAWQADQSTRAAV